MKRKLNIQPAPRAQKPQICPCGVEVTLQHQCRWRRPASSTSPTGNRARETALIQQRPNPATVAQRRKIVIHGSLPSRRRKPKLALATVAGQVTLKGMPNDVFHPEPFNAYPIPTIGVVHRMVEHYLRVWAPQQGAPFSFEGHPNPYISLLWPYALQDATIFEGLIAMCRASWLLEHGQNAANDRAFNYHHHNSRFALQKRLENPATFCDDTTLLSMLTLTTIDYTLGEHALAGQYLQSMRQMVALRGGVRDNTDWNKFLASVVVAFEMLWSFILSSGQQNDPPATPDAEKPSEILKNAIPVYANHPFPPDYTASLSRIPQGLSNLAVSSLLSMQCVRIIERIPSSPQTSSRDSHGSAVRSSAGMHSILTDLLKLTALSTTKMEHVLCHGLVAYCLPLQYGNPLPIGCTRTLQTSVDAYMKLNFRENEEKLDGKCLLWIAIVIASSLDICADEDLRNAPVLERILNRFPQARNWDNVEKILRTFLWHEDLAPQWWTTWQSVMRRRSSPPMDTGTSPQPFTPVSDASPRSAQSSMRIQSSPVPVQTPNRATRERTPQHRSMKVSNLIND